MRWKKRRDSRLQMTDCKKRSGRSSSRAEDGIPNYSRRLKKGSPGDGAPSFCLRGKTGMRFLFGQLITALKIDLDMIG